MNEQEVVSVKTDTIAITISYLIITIVIMLLVLTYKQALYAALVSFVYTATLTYFAKRKNDYVDSALRWNKVKANVLQSRVIKKKCIGTRQNDIYTPYIKYSFVFEGKKYISDRFNLIDCRMFYNKQAAQKILNALSKQKEIYVYFDPENPSDSVAYLRDYKHLKESYPLILLLVLVPQILFILFA